MDNGALRNKVYKGLEAISNYHYSECQGSVNDKHFPVNPVLETLTYFLNKNCLLTGDPGWGKTTSAKIVTSVLSGVPYDLLDSTEIRGHPHLYEEKLTGRFDFHELTTKGEKVLWRPSFSMPSLIVDEANWIPYEGQAVILQGIETGRWLYMDHSFFEGKKPTYFAINKRPEEGNGLWHALEDRVDISLPFEPLSTTDMLFLQQAKERVERELYDNKITEEAMRVIKNDRKKLTEYFDNLSRKEKAFSAQEKEMIKKQISEIPFDDDATLFLQSFTAELNFSQKYGKKRSEDGISEDTHDKNYIGVFFKNSLSPRAWMAVRDYSSALAWLLDDKKVTRNHLEFIIPYAIHHKLKPTNDLRNELAGKTREVPESLFIAGHAMRKAADNYEASIQPTKNLINKLQLGKLSEKEIKELKEEAYDHPFVKDLIRKVKEPKPFYNEGK